MNGPLITLKQFARSSVGVATLAMLLATPAVAQQIGSNATPMPDDSVVELSPFVVDTTTDTGYAASSTLAGSRLRTDLRDVAASVTVLTKDFLEDIGAVDGREALLFTPNVETSANFTDFQRSTLGVPDDGATAANPQLARVRGIGSPTRTRNFFPTYIPYDGYNADRLEISRGPNSVLFGTGSPAGVNNTTLSRADLRRNRNEVGFHVASFGEYRAHLNLSRVLVRDRLAIRVAMMDTDKRISDMKPQYDRDTRFFASGTVKPFPKTTIRVNLEQVDRDFNRPSPTPPTDGVSGWLAAGRPTRNVVTSGGGGFVAPLRRLEQFQTAPMLVFNRPDDPTPTIGYAMETSSGSPLRRLADTNSLTRDLPGYFVPSLTNEAIYPFRDVNINASSYNLVEIRSTQVLLEQELARNWFVEAGFSRESYDNFQWNPVRTHDRAIRVDPNVVLNDGSPNPNFLRPFINTQAVGFDRSSDREDFRVTTAYELNLSDKTRGWVGRQLISALYETSEEYVRNFSVRPTAVTDNTAVFGTGNRNALKTRHYIGEPITDPNNIVLYANPYPVNLDQNFSDVPYLYRSGTTWRTDTIGSTAFSPWTDGVRHDETRGQGYGATLQSYLLKNRLVVTAGARSDSRKIRRSPPIGRDEFNRAIVDERWVLNPDYDDPIKGDTSTFGVVAHPLSWLSFHFNSSNTFQPTVEGVNLLGEKVGSPEGEGVDYGISLLLFDGKLQVRVNNYETDQINDRNHPLNRAILNRVINFERGLRDDLVELGRGAEWIPPASGFVDVQPDNIVDVAETASEGTEIEVVYNPTRNWRIAFNASRQQTIRTNIGLGLRQYLVDRTPYWTPFFTSLGPEDGPAKLRNLQTNILFPVNNAIAEEGQPPSQEREWRANFVTRYTFSNEGPFKGFSVSATARWAERPKIGFPIIFIPNPANPSETSPVSDPTRPYYGDEDLNFSVSLNYRRKIFKDIDWRVSLQVRNLLQSDSLIPIGAQPDGTPAVFRIPEPMAFRLSNSFRF